MNCPYCELVGIVAEVIQVRNLSRCSKCLQDMSCSLTMTHKERIIHRQRWCVLEMKEATA